MIRALRLAVVCAALVLVPSLPAADNTPPFDPTALPFAAEMRGQSAMADDELLGRRVLAITAGSATFLSHNEWRGEYVAEALVRLDDPDPKRPAGGATLQCGVRDTADGRFWACALAVSRLGERGARIEPSLGENRPWTLGADRNRRRAWTALTIKERFPASDISPVMDEDFRLSLEQDLAKIPTGDRVWRRLRIEVRAGSLRLYHNGLLVADDDRSVAGEGRVLLSLRAPVRLAALEVRPLPDPEGIHYPVPLDDICNAAKRLTRDDAALDRAGVPGDVPFIFPSRPDGLDHVHVAASVFRHRMTEGYAAGGDPAVTIPSALDLDPACLMLRVPNAAWRRAWVLAASDGAPNSVPVVTLRFFKPGRGWPVDAEETIPDFTAEAGPRDDTPIRVKTPEGREANLWLVPIDLNAAALASDYRNESVLNLEFTKKVADWRAYPDPAGYGSFQAGLPSSVRIYALTLEKAPVAAHAGGDANANLYPYPHRPVWRVRLVSQAEADVDVDVTCVFTAPDGTTETSHIGLTVPPGRVSERDFHPQAPLYGLYRVVTTVSTDDWRQSRRGTFLVLPPERRKANAANSPWGIWCWFGTHDTNPDPTDNVRIMRALGIAAGAKLELTDPMNLIFRARAQGPYLFRKNWGVAPAQYRIVGREPPAWSRADEPDPAERAAFLEEIAAKAKELTATHPDLQYVNTFAENAISLRTTHGLPPYAVGEPWFQYTDTEKERIRSLFRTAVAAFEGVRREAPKVKFLFGHCAPMFFPHFFREPDWNNDLFDGFGLDMPQFERMPERPPRATEPNLLYFLHKEMQERGIKKELVHLESYFPPSHPLALGYRGQADSVVRTAVLSLAMGTTKFLGCWSLHDSADRWGSQHYGSAGLIGRAPEFNPKPAAAAYATMSRVLDLAKFDGWLPTGSRSAYCVRFRDAGKMIYCLWTIRGSRPLTLKLRAGRGKATAVDENGNESALNLENGAATVTIRPTPLWVVVTGDAVETAEAGPPVYPYAPGPHRVLLDDFEKADWAYDGGAYPRYATNHWDVARRPGRMESARVRSDERGSTVWRVALAERPEGKPFVRWYGVFTPPAPIPLPGKASAIGLQANGRSAWNRIIYEITDAKGEIWQSIGVRDAWNCDDIHSWSYLNHDGWRWMEFPLPGNAPGDDFREKDSVWWNHSDDGIVDLPVRLSRIIVEMSTHQIYVNEALPVEDLSVEFDDLTAVYADAEMMTDKPVAAQRAAAGMLRPSRETTPALPNPLEELSRAGVGAPPEILRLEPPETGHDGTRIFAVVGPVEGAAEYRAWVAAYPDGRGAQVFAKGPDPKLLLRRLKPNLTLYFFATYLDAEGKESKPSAAHRSVLKDEFPMK